MLYLSHRNVKGNRVMTNQSSVDTSNLIKFSDFTRSRNASTVTGWRWRKKGWIKTVKIKGMLFVHKDDVAAFNTRSLNGDFKRAAQSEVQP